MDRYVIVDVITKKVINSAIWDGISDWVPGHEKIAVRSDTAELDWNWHPDTNELTPPISE